MTAVAVSTMVIVSSIFKNPATALSRLPLLQTHIYKTRKAASFVISTLSYVSFPYHTKSTHTLSSHYPAADLFFGAFAEKSQVFTRAPSCSSLPPALQPVPTLLPRACPHSAFLRAFPVSHPAYKTTTPTITERPRVIDKAE
jgi:hypothetical protein